MKGAFKYVLVILLVAIQKNSIAQTINIGDSLPDITLNNVLNFTSGTFRLSDFKGKAVILDYWSFSCVACLLSFPKLDSLQRQFTDQVQIILVNHENKSETETFFRKREKLKISSIPMVTGDTLLSNLFPHTGVPFIVWIDRSGKYYSSTDGGYLTEANLKLFVENKKVNLPLATVSRYETSLFKEQMISSLTYFSYFAKCIDRGGFHITGLETAAATVNTYYCKSIVNMYQTAYNESENDGPYKFREPGRTILDVKERFRYEYPHNPSFNDQWRASNSYYYHSLLPDERKKERFKIMQQDLQRYFNLEVSVIKRKVRCLSLVRTSKIDKLKTRGGIPIETTFEQDPRNIDTLPERFLRNKPFKNLFNIIKNKGEYQLGIKTIDKTGYSGNIDFKINENLLENLTIATLRKELRRYDLDLIEQYISMDVLILKEKTRR